MQSPLSLLILLSHKSTLIYIFAISSNPLQTLKSNYRFHRKSITLMKDEAPVWVISIPTIPNQITCTLINLISTHMQSTATDPRMWLIPRNSWTRTDWMASLSRWVYYYQPASHPRRPQRMWRGKWPRIQQGSIRRDWKRNLNLT